jgi:cytochrome c biogenesis protein CcdA/thiol-disulfide isomerase/thioredoxin
MLIQILFAILAGILTVGAPCILPMLPLLLATTIGKSGKLRPLFITLGFVITFALLAFLFGLFTHILGLSQNVLRDIAVVLLIVFGIFMIWPWPFEKLTEHMSRILGRATVVSQSGGSGNFGGFLLGIMLGIIWTPCAGPVLGSILTLIATRQNLSGAVILLTAYAIGAGIPMIVIAYGGQYVSTRVRGFAKYSRHIQQIFGALVILLAVAIYFNFDTIVEAKLIQYAPDLRLSLPASTNSIGSAANSNPSNNGIDKTELADYGPAPEFTGIDKWLNGSPQTIAGLKGKVVLVDFWTYSCIDCLRTLPYVTQWYNTYNKDGFVVIGVHTPEFAFEKDSSNVMAAITRNGIKYPVAQDNEYATWTAYHNDSWPAEYLINQNGEIVAEDFGEGNYDVMENNIRSLLGLTPSTNTVVSSTPSTLPDFNQIETPETYFGLERQQYMSPQQQALPGTSSYTLPANLNLNQFGVGGIWDFESQYAELSSGSGSIAMHVHASKIYMVAQSGDGSASAKPITVKIYIDGTFYKDLTIQASQLYTLFDSSQYQDHVIKLVIPQSGLEAYTFTFG